MSKQEQESVVDEIIRLWADSFPGSAYGAGIGEDADVGRMNSLEDNFARSLNRRVDELRIALPQIEDAELRACADKILSSISQSFKLSLPGDLINECAGTSFYMLLKQFNNKPVLQIFLNNVGESVSQEIEALKSQSIPVEMQRTCLELASFLKGNIQILLDQENDARLIAQLQAANAQVDKYIGSFDIDNILTGETAELLKIFEQHQSPASPTPGYAEILKCSYDIPFSPERIKRRALVTLKCELKRVNKLARQVTEDLRLSDSDSLQEVYDGMGNRFLMDENNFFENARSMMDVTSAYLREHIQSVRREDDPPLKKPPDNLKNLLTSAGTIFFDYMTPTPAVTVFVPPERNKSKLTLLNVLMHEYAHAYQISRLNLESKSRLLQISTSLMIPLFEAVGFHREWEFYEEAAGLIGLYNLTGTQKDYLGLFSQGGISPDIGVRAFELETRVWRVIRLIRALFDVEVNLGEKTYTEFINSASKATGLSKETIHNECFTFLGQPGYAPAYGICGMDYKRLQKKLKSKGVSRKRFNTQACDMGFWPWTLAIKRIDRFQ